MSLVKKVPLILGFFQMIFVCLSTIQIHTPILESLPVSTSLFHLQQIKKPAAAAVVKKESPNSSCQPEGTTAASASTDDKAKKAWPPDPSTCSEFTPVVYSIQELERELANQQAMEREKQVQ